MSTALPFPDSHARGWTSGRSLYLYALLLLTFMAASSVPTPLYRLYQEAWRFSPVLLTTIFGVYALSLLLALLTVGSLSDHIGRRPVVLAAIGLEIVSMLVFLFASGPGWLIVARTLQGFATGAATSTLSAGMLDADSKRGALVNGIAPFLGLAAGALGCGALVDFGPAPLRLVFLVLILIFALQIVAVVRSPETTPGRPGALASLRPSVGVPAASRRNFLLAMPISIACWGLGGFYLSLIPSIVRIATGATAALAGSAVVATLALTAALSVFVARQVEPLRVIAIAAVTLIAGVTTSLAGVAVGSVLVMLGGSVVAGFGFGAGFLGALRTALADAEPQERASLMATLYIISYLAFSLPAVAAGIAITRFGMQATTYGYGGGLVLLSLATLVAAILVLRPSRRWPAGPRRRGAL